MTPYFLMYSVTAIHAFFNNKKTKYMSLIIYMFVIIFYAMRKGVGTDWHHYEYYFNNIFSNGPDIYSFEIGYRFLNVIFASVFKSYRSLVIAVAIFNGILFWKASNTYTSNLGLMLLLSVYFMFYPTLEAFRQSIPIFLFLYSLKYIDIEKNKYFFINIIGILFHYTGFITIIFYFFHKYKKVKWGIVISLILFSVIEPFVFSILNLVPVLANKYYWYFVVEATENSIFSFKTLEGVFILIISYLFSKKKKLRNRYEYISVNLVLLGLLLQLTLGRISDIIYRMTYYTDLGIILFCVFLYDKLKLTIYKYVYVIVIIAYVTARLWRVFPFEDPRFFYNIL